MTLIPLRVLFLATCLVLVVHTPARAVALLNSWAQRFGDTATQFGTSVTTDASGNVILTGYGAGTVNFGGANLTSAGSFDVFVAKFNGAGVHQWSKHFGDGGTQDAFSVATDASGNVVIAGFFGSVINFGGGNLTSVGFNDIFIAKFNSAGVHQWSQRFGDTEDQFAFSVATDASSNVILTGHFNGTVNFGGGNLTSVGSTDIFVAKFNSAGVHQWSQRFGDASSQSGLSVATDAGGNAYLTGSFSGMVNFGGVFHTSLGSTDIFIAKLNSAGVHQFSQRFGDASAQAGNSVAVDGGGNPILTGNFAGTANFGGGVLTSLGSTDIFAAKFSTTGVHQWSQRFGDASAQTGDAVETDASGNVILTGNFNGVVNFGGGNLTSAGATDIFIAKFGPTGVHEVSARYGDGGAQSSESVATDGAGNVFATGNFQSSVNFGNGVLTSAGGDDMFLARFRVVEESPVITSIEDIGNDQGRQVKIRFTRSGFDDGLVASPVVRYDAFRRDDAPPASLGGPVSDMALLADGWTQVGSISAYTDDTYGIDVTTIGDSTITNGMYHSVFFIRAGTALPSVFYDSDSDSGYSVDNLAPGIPAALAINAGGLSWAVSKAEDFDYFSVYGGATNAFGAATLIAYTTSPEFNVVGHTYYFVTATDFSGNEGEPAVINALTGIGGTPTSYVLSVSAYPNPFNPSTTIRYTLPSKGRVTIAVYDARGVRIATLLNEERSAGAFTTPWNGSTDSGVRVSSGVYFARVTHASGTKSYKMVLLK